jgi:hypothetical protein
MATTSTTCKASEFLINQSNARFELKVFREMVEINKVPFARAVVAKFATAVFDQTLELQEKNRGSTTQV